MTFLLSFLLFFCSFLPLQAADMEVFRCPETEAIPLPIKQPASATLNGALLFQRSTSDLFKNLKNDVLLGCHPNKSLIYRQFFDQTHPRSEMITVSAQPNNFDQNNMHIKGFLPAMLSPVGFKTTTREVFFPYAVYPPEPETLLVTLNFADAELFGFYKTGLLAQDELQSFEFPELALMREQLKKENPLLLNAKKTSLIIHNVQRFCVFDSQKYINGRTLYGNNFQYARPEEILKATALLKSPQTATILPVLAPNVCREPIYTPEILEEFLSNLIIGFGHAQTFTKTIGKAHLMIHSGGIGTGAFGHNTIVSIFLQLVAAQCVSCTLSELKDSPNLKIMFYGTPPQRLLAAQTMFEELRRRLEISRHTSFRNGVEIILQIISKYNLSPHCGTGE